MAYSFDIWYVVSPGRPLPILFKSCPWGKKGPHLESHIFYIGLYGEKHEQIFLSDTTRPRALIFGM